MERQLAEGSAAFYLRRCYLSRGLKDEKEPALQRMKAGCGGLSGRGNERVTGVPGRGMDLL